MFAYVLILIAILSRLVLSAAPHPEWFNFTAVAVPCSTLARGAPGGRCWLRWWC